MENKTFWLTFTAVNKEGKEVKEKIPCKSVSNAINELEKMGYTFINFTSWFNFEDNDNFIPNDEYISLYPFEDTYKFNTDGTINHSNYLMD